MKKIILTSLALLALLATPAMAKNDGNHGNGKGRGHPHEKAAPHDNDSSQLSLSESGLRFRSDDLNVVFNWFDENPARPDYRGLPPGIAKKLARGGSLPPGLQGRQLPPGLAKRLGPVPGGYERIIIGNDLVLVELSTRTITDIIRGIFN